MMIMMIIMMIIFYGGDVDNDEGDDDDIDNIKPLFQLPLSTGMKYHRCTHNGFSN